MGHERERERGRGRESIHPTKNSFNTSKKLLHKLLNFHMLMDHTRHTHQEFIRKPNKCLMQGSTWG